MGRRRRTTELGLFVLIILITGGCYVLVGFSEEASLPADIIPFLGLVLGLLLVAHLAIRRWAPLADGTLLPLAALLNGVGYVFIARLNEGLADNQATWTMLGIAAFVSTLVVIRDINMLEQYRWTLALVGVGLLLLPLLPVVGLELNGARLWAQIGPVNFQPGEFAKIALVVFFASYLVENRELLALTDRRIGPVGIPEPRLLAPVLAAWSASLVIMVAERDLGSSLLFFTTFVTLLWVATGRRFYLALGGAMFAAGALVSWSAFGHVRERVDTWLDPWSDLDGAGFQIGRAQFGLADGGITGTGPGQGRPDLIPLAETDFIFATIGEELGLLGGTAVLTAYLLMVGVGLRTAIRSRAGFETLLATGLTFILGFQAFIIIGGVLRVVPLTGITLPFVSYGGSSLLANYVLVALLVRTSHQVAEREDTTASPAEAPTPAGAAS